MPPLCAVEAESGGVAAALHIVGGSPEPLTLRR